MSELAEAIADALPPLRGLGPRVFVSYSFRDSELAEGISSHLRQAGMQVRMEDETSLLGSRLSAALPSRIGGAEVLVQILTAASASSAWVAREFDWAVAAQSKGAGPRVLLPLVVGEVTVPGPVADWVYLRIPAVPDERALETIRRAAMTSVATLPVDPGQPCQFAAPELAAYCSDTALSDRRLIVDPAAVIPAMIRATVVHGAGAAAQYRQPLVAQQRRAYDRFLRRLAVLDAYLPEFVRRVRPMASGHWAPGEWPARLGGVIQCFARLAIGPTVLYLAEHWRVAVAGELTPQAAAYCEAALAKVQELQAGRPGQAGAGHTFWAVGGTAGQRWLDLGFAGKEGKEGAYLFLPEDHFDEIGILSLTRAGDRPDSEVTVTDWLTIGLPQVAVSKLPAHPLKVTEAAQSTGWSLSDYRPIRPSLTVAARAAEAGPGGPGRGSL